MDDLPVMSNQFESFTWNGEEFDILKLHKVLKRDEKAMTYKRRAVERYRKSDKGRVRQRAANMKFRAKNKVSPTPVNSPETV